MLPNLLRLMRISMMMLLLGMMVACGGGTPDPAEIPIDVAVQQTVDARDAVDLQVRQTVDAQLTAQAPAVAEVPAGGDVADPNNSSVPVAEPVADPNLAGGTPQLRVTFSSVNVRRGPGVNYPVMNILRQDAVVVVAAKNQTGSWFLIDLPGGTRGWISNTVTTPVAEADMLKVAVAATIPAPPPTATATPTATPTATAVPATATAASTTAPTATSAATTSATATTRATATPTATAPATTAPTATPTATTQVVVSVTFTVLNNSSTDICFLFIDLSRDPWGDDRLGPTEVILPGGQVSLGGFPADEYDFMAQDCSGDIINTLFNTQVNGNFTWDVR